MADTTKLTIVSPDGSESFNLYAIDIDRTGSASIILDNLDVAADEIIGYDFSVERREWNFIIKAGEYINNDDYPNSFSYDDNGFGYQEELHQRLNEWGLLNGTATLEWNKPSGTYTYDINLTDVSGNLSSGSSTDNKKEWELSVTAVETDAQF